MIVAYRHRDAPHSKYAHGSASMLMSSEIVLRPAAVAPKAYKCAVESAKRYLCCKRARLAQRARSDTNASIGSMLSSRCCGRRFGGCSVGFGWWFRRSVPQRDDVLCDVWWRVL